MQRVWFQVYCSPECRKAYRSDQVKLGRQLVADSLSKASTSETLDTR